MSLKVWLPLTGDLRNLGTSNLAVTVNGATVDNNGKIGKCYAFNGSTNYIALSGNDLFKIFTGGTQQFSITMWIFHADTTRAILFGDYSTSGGIGFNIELSTAHAVRFYWNGSPDTYPANATVAASGWTHIALTYNGTKLQSYINGVEKGSWSGTLAVKNKTSGEFRLGRDNRSDSTAFNGRMNDFRVYDHCLSLSEVREIAQGLILHYKFDKIPTEVINAYTTPYFDSSAASGGWSHWGSSGKHDGSFAINTDKQYIFFKDKDRNHKVSNGPTATATYLTYQSPAFEGGYRSLQCIVKESEGREITEDILVPDWNARSGGAPAAKWTRIIPLGNDFYLCQVDGIKQNGSNDLIGFNLKPGYTVYFSAAWCENDKEVCSEVLFPYNEIEDSSGYNHNGEAVGDFKLINSEGRYRIATYFNCSEPNTNNDNGITYIETPLSLTEPTALTFAWWAKPESGYNGSVSHAAFCTSNSATRPTDYNATAFHHRDSSFDICPVSGSGIRLPLAYTQNQWHHYAVTYDGKTARAYKDGEQTATVAFSANNALKTFSKLFIGYSQAGGVHRKTLGSYSDFRVYVTALLDNDIKKLYNTSMSVDKAHRTHTFELEEKTANLLFPTENSRIQLEFGHGLSRYTQTNCQVTLTQDGYHIYRPPNLTTADDGNSMYGGLKLVNQSTDSIAEYDSIRDNIWDLQQGHTYLFTCHIEGQSTQGVNFGWTNNMGWGGHGMSPSPTWIINSGVPTNFEGHRDSVCIFTINDEIVKPCTSAYSSYTLNTEYLSYRHFTLNWGYGSTGALGTDLYLTHFQLYDITDKIGQVLKNGVVDFSSFNEEDIENAKIQRSNIFFADGFIER